MSNLDAVRSVTRSGQLIIGTLIAGVLVLLAIACLIEKNPTALRDAFRRIVSPPMGRSAKERVACAALG
jgi:hypothetical protein